MLETVNDQERPEQVRAITRDHGVAAAVNAPRGGATRSVSVARFSQWREN
jgi:hypothetical protein